MPTATPIQRFSPQHGSKPTPTYVAQPARSVELSGVWMTIFSSTEPVIAASPQTELPLNVSRVDMQIPSYAFAVPATPIFEIVNTWIEWSSHFAESFVRTQDLVMRAAQNWTSWGDMIARIVPSLATVASARLIGMQAEAELAEAEDATTPAFTWTASELERIPRRRPAQPAVALDDPYTAFKRLGQWLNASDDEIALAVGVGRTTPYTWRRESRTPNARTLRKLYQLHSTLSAVVQHLDEPRLEPWLYESNARRRNALLTGDWASIQDDVDVVVFGVNVPPREQPGTWVPTGHEE